LSVKAITWVWEHSESSGTARMVLLAIADAADHHGANAWPSQPTLAAMCRISVRTVIRAVAELEQLGELEVIQHGGPAYREDRRPNRYRLVKMSPPTGCQLVTPLLPPRGDNRAPRGDKYDERGDTAVTLPTLSNPSFSEQKIPSGGSLRETDPSKDSDMTRTPNPSDALPLEFTDGQEAMSLRGRQAGKAAAMTGAQAVVAAYVDAFRRHHDSTDPAKSSKGRVARDAAQLLATGTKHEVLLEAATAMGATPYSNLPVQVSMLSQRGGPSKGVAPIAPAGSFDQAAAERHARFLEEVRTDPDAAAWVARDPAQVAKLIAEDPTLAPVFARLGAA